MLSGAKHLVASITYEDEILRLPPQDDIKTQAPRGEECNYGPYDEGEIFFGWCLLTPARHSVFASLDKLPGSGLQKHTQRGTLNENYQLGGM